MSTFEAIILGIVQGLTEFLPISSTGHLRIVPAFVGWDDPGSAFTAVIQLGTTAAVLIYFREDLWRIARAWLSSVREGPSSWRALLSGGAVPAGAGASAGATPAAPPGDASSGPSASRRAEPADDPGSHRRGNTRADARLGWY